MIKPNDLPLVCLPVDLSDEAATTLIEFLHEFTAALESHYCAQLMRYRDSTHPPQHDLVIDHPPDTTDPPF